MYHIFSIHSSVNGHLVCFHVLAKQSGNEHWGTYIFLDYCFLWMDLPFYRDGKQISNLFFKLFTYLFYLFFPLWLHWVFVAAPRLSLVAMSEGYSLLQFMVSHYSGFSGCRAWALERSDFSSCSWWALECQRSSCDAQVWLLHSTWDLPRPRVEPMSPVLAGRLLTTAPPGKSSNLFLYCK